MKILIAEDDENSRKLLETVLVGNGYTVISAENGAKALNLLQSETVDLVISDILMPEMDGYGLCKAMKQNFSLQKIPLIFYTATYVSDQDERFAMSLGANKFLIKPMILNDFLAEVADVLKPGQTVRPMRKGGLHRTNTNKLDKQHADRVRAKLDEKIEELNEEKSKLALSESRFRDFAEASANWFWESDQDLNFNVMTNGPIELNVANLLAMAQMCHSHSPNEMLKALKAHQAFADFIIHYTEASGKMHYIRLSAKPVFDKNYKFLMYRGVARDVTDVVSLNRRVEYLATHDELTGLPNRTQFRQRLDHAIAKSSRAGNQVLLLYFDLDNFKMINDTLGHEAGDQLLLMAAKRIRENVRASDLVCRIGGDEFVMIMEGASPQDGHRCVRQIIQAFTKPFEVDNQRVYCTVSIGLSVYPDDASDSQRLLVYADLAMYRAKQNGRNDFQFYTSNLNYIAHQWLEMEHGIRQALKEKQFFLAYQPQLNVETGEVTGLEALLRWRHPERGLIPPMEFIKIAEQTSLINDVGDYVLNAACVQLRAWLDTGFSVPRISINISPRHLRSDKFFTSFNTILAQHQITPNMLCLEITETALLEDSDNVRKNMRQLKDAGVAISLDDFGMGHSSLLYIRRWSVDEIKVDRSFVDGLEKEDDDRTIVKAVIALGKALELDLVAEGVENQAQADILAKLGCKVVQGFHYAHPLLAEEVEEWVESAKN